MQVTFFGHSDAPQEIKREVLKTIVYLIEEKGIKKFLVGAEGQFDAMVRSVLRELKKTYKTMEYSVVLAYMPKPELRYYDDYGDTVFPEEVADSLPRFAIAKRNEWMLKRSDVVVTYVKRSFGGAFKYKQKAIKKGKFVIELASD